MRRQYDDERTDRRTAPGPTGMSWSRAYLMKSQTIRKYEAEAHLHDDVELVLEPLAQRRIVCARSAPRRKRSQIRPAIIATTLAQILVVAASRRRVALAAPDTREDGRSSRESDVDAIGDLRSCCRTPREGRSKSSRISSADLT